MKVTWLLLHQLYLEHSQWVHDFAQQLVAYYIAVFQVFNHTAS